MEDVRDIKVGLYRDLVEVCMLVESVWDMKNVPELAAAIKKLKEVLVIIRKEGL